MCVQKLSQQRRGHVLCTRRLTDKAYQVAAFCASSCLVLCIPKFVLARALGLIALIVVIAVPVALTSKKGHSSSDASTGSGGGDNGGGGGDNGGGSGGNNGTESGGQPSKAPITGGSGSTVTTDKNTTFTYANSFGGFWVSDPDDPFSMNAQAQSYVFPFSLLFYAFVNIG